MRKTYKRYVRAINNQYYHNNRWPVIENEEVASLSSDLAEDSNEVSEYADSMRDEIYALVKTIRDAKEISDKKASKDKRLRIFLRSMKMFNVGIGVGASVSQLAPQPAGLAATVALGTASVLITSATEATDKYRESKRKYTITGLTSSYSDERFPQLITARLNLMLP